MNFPSGSVGKESACTAGDAGLIPGLGRSPGGGHGNPLHYCCLENRIDRGAWQATAHRVTKSRTQLSNQHFTLPFRSFQVVLVVKNPPASAGNVRDVGSIPGSERFPWMRAWQPTPAFLPGESHRQRSLAGYSP